MTRIERVLTAPAAGGYYYEDLAALQANPMPVDLRYTAPAVTPGFQHVREPAEAVSVGLLLDDGQIAWGDCVSVVYGGKAGREPVFRREAGLATIQSCIVPFFEGRELTSFRELAGQLEQLTEWAEEPAPEQIGRSASTASRLEPMSRRDLLAGPTRFLRKQREEANSASGKTIRVERRLHSAVRYGVSQALLAAVALTRRQTMAEVIAQEWGLPAPDRPIPLHAQSGGDHREGADKMIIRRLASLPDLLVDHIPELLGEDGRLLSQYVSWLKERIGHLAPADYRPAIHLDVHGALGTIVQNNLGKVLGHLYALEYAAQPYSLRIESPVIMDSRQGQIDALKTLREYIGFRKMSVQIVADEWANTLEDIRAFVEAGAGHMIRIKMPDLGSIHQAVEAVLACQAGGMGAFLGGSCAETELSARVAAHVALATRPDLLMARPGMGGDEGIMLAQNEIARTLATIAASASLRSSYSHCGARNRADRAGG